MSNEDWKVKMDHDHSLMLNLREKLLENLKSQALVVSGDTHHMGIKEIVDKIFPSFHLPRDHEHQALDHHQHDTHLVLDSFLPDNRFASSALTTEAIQNTLDGTGSLVLSGREIYGRCIGCRQPLSMEMTPNSVHFVAGDSTLCESFKDFALDFYFPTGEVYFGDWFDVFSAAEDAGLLKDSSESVSSTKGIVANSRNYASHQIAHFFVGNSSPGLNINRQTHDIMIGRLTEYDEQTDEDVALPQFASYERVGGFSTELWWATMMDKEHFEKLRVAVQEKGQAIQDFRGEPKMAKIKPGTYRFKPHYGMDPMNLGTHDNPVYITAEYLGETDCCQMK
jgi:hypothetical protein